MKKRFEVGVEMTFCWTRVVVIILLFWPEMGLGGIWKLQKILLSSVLRDLHVILYLWKGPEADDCLQGPGQASNGPVEENKNQEHKSRR